MGAAQCGKCGEDGKFTALHDDLQKDEATQDNDEGLRLCSATSSVGGGSTSSLTGRRPSQQSAAVAVATTMLSSGFGSGSSFGGSSRPESARSMGGGRGLASSLSPRRPTQQAIPSSERMMALQEACDASAAFRRAMSVDAVTARRQGLGHQPLCNSERGNSRKKAFNSLPGDDSASSSAADRFRQGGRAVAAGVRLHKILATSRADVPPVKCAVSVEKLNAFEEQAKKVMGDAYPKATVRDIISAIIRPACDGAGKAYARTLNDDQPCTGQVFVCHCWDQTFAELVEGVNNAFRHWPMKPNLWISMFALVQTRRRTPCTRPSDAPFAAALSKARGILVLQSKQVDVYSRLWTLWEMYLASKFGILDKKGGLILAGDPGERGSGGGGAKPIDSQAALTSDPEDRRSIADAICAEEKAYDGVNAVATLIRDSHR